MRKLSFSLLLVSFILIVPAVAQKTAPKKPATPPPLKEQKRYPSLLWEITGNGLKKPSYLFGTMHVSDKLAFHLGDSFYTAIKNVEVVALETNPEFWQDDFSNSVFYKNPRGYDMDEYASISDNGPDDLLSLTSFAIDSYDEALKASLAVEPSMINGMLYRTYGNKMDDFEEDTYLDLYIFQTGKKLGKRLTGVENFEESEKLVMEAYRDMIKDRNKKKKSYDFESMYTNPKKVEEAYRRGDLDVLDSLEMLTVYSDAFQEKFMYRRNDIQANSIDSIIKKSTLFVGVGAAHLPGRRGVIELLRKMGYSLRPVRMDERNSTQKDIIDKTRNNTSFNSITADDGFYQVSIPGKKFYHFTEWSGMDVVQYADMVNGAYYMVTRIKTNSLSWGHSEELVHRKIDSMLYENIPGKILKKTSITRNGYKGWEIQNRTRRGDYQRYNMYITPFEVLIFKMSGNGEYINGGSEAEQFFGSVKMKENKEPGWISYQPPTGGFSAQLPHSPSLLKDVNYGAKRLEYAAVDSKDGNSYVVMKSNLHNYSFAEEDTFELNLMSESYAFSSFIDKELSRKFSRLNGYPALDCKYRHKDGSFSTVKYIIRGPIYYTIAAHHKVDNDNVKRFIGSFAITPFIYPEVKPRSDSVLRFTVQSPLPLYDKEKDEMMNNLAEMMKMYEDEDDDEPSYGYSGEDYKTRFIGNDTIGEKILVTYNSPGKYSYFKDTAALWEKTFFFEGEDSSFIYRLDKKQDFPGGAWTRDLQLTDTGSSRLILSRAFYKDGHMFTITTLTDTLSARSSFIDKFFTSFAPVDTLKKESLFTRKSAQFFDDYFSTDSAVAKKARKNLYNIEFDSLDVALLKMAIERVNWNTKDYLDVKKHFINELSQLEDSTITPFLRDLYWKIKDSADLQTEILEALLRQETQASFIAFKDLIIQEPPIDTDNSDYGGYSGSRRNIRFYLHGSASRYNWYGDPESDEERYYGQWSQLYDTLSLTKKIFPDILQLINIDDYKKEVLNLLTVMVDSGYLKAADYEAHFSKLYLDGKQLLKKQMASEEKDNIEKASNKDKRSRYGYDEDEEDKVLEEGNEQLGKYAILLLPFYDKNPGVAAFFDQLMKTRDRQLLYKSFILMLRNNKKVSDTLFDSFAKLDDYRLKLYKDLQKMKKLDKFPAAWKSQKEIARAIFTTHEYSYDKPDSVVYIDKLPVEYKGKKGWVYFFKYRQMRDDTYWQLAAVGMQPENLSEVDVKNRQFTETEERRLENDKPEKEQMQKMLKEMVYAKRSSAAQFYNSRAYSIYKTYLSEMVKSRRYRD
jgi:uncharacterized protein YbaP (TraB family)